MLERMRKRLENKYNLDNIDILKTLEYLKKDKSIWKYRETVFKALRYRYDEDLDKVIHDIKLSKSMGTAITQEKMILTYGNTHGKELYEKSCKDRAITKNNMINKHGVDEGIRRWNNYRIKQAKSNTFEHKNKKYGWTRDEYD